MNKDQTLTNLAGFMNKLRSPYLPPRSWSLSYLPPRFPLFPFPKMYPKNQQEGMFLSWSKEKVRWCIGGGQVPFALVLQWKERPNLVESKVVPSKQLGISFQQCSFEIFHQLSFSFPHQLYCSSSLLSEGSSCFHLPVLIIIPWVWKSCP